MSDDAPKRTSLYDEHVKLGARMVPFAGYDMPVQYPTGIIAEHNWTRENAGLFDVSHMGQCVIAGAELRGRGQGHGKAGARRCAGPQAPAAALFAAPHRRRAARSTI